VVPWWAPLPLVAVLIVAGFHIVVDGAAAGEAFGIAVRTFLGLTVVAILIHSEVKAFGLDRALSLLKWWCAGVAVNALVAVLSAFGFLNISALLIGPTTDDGLPIVSSRAVGLTFHPNSLAFGLLIALPSTVLIAHSYARGMSRLMWLIAIALEGTGLVLADSRAGLGIGLAALLGSLIVILRKTKAGRFAIPVLGIAALAAIPFAVSALAETRLAPGAGTLSDIGRTQFNLAAFAYFAENPVFGAGYSASSGTSMYLQLLSEGGILALAGHLIFISAGSSGIFVTAPRLIRGIGVISLAVTLLFVLFQPGTTERATWWPVLLLAMWGTIPSGNRNAVDPFYSEPPYQASAPNTTSTKLAATAEILGMSPRKARR
jgi:hypothetical protein